MNRKTAHRSTLATTTATTDCTYMAPIKSDAGCCTAAADTRGQSDHHMTGYITRAIDRIASWLPSADKEVPAVDEEYIRTSRQFQSYWFVDVVDRDELEGVRCNLCGQLFHLEETAAAFSHVADHDRDGDGSVDPFQRRHRPTSIALGEEAEKRQRPATYSAVDVEHVDTESRVDETSVVDSGVYEWIRENDLTASELREQESSAGPDMWTDETLAELDDDQLPEQFWTNGGRK